jgi:transcriptional regulator with XRE-family HTH domain
MLAEILRIEMKDKGLALRTAAGEIGVSHTTLARAMRGETVDFETLVRIASWLNMSVSSVVNTFDEDEESAVLNGIAALVEAEPELREVFLDAGRMVANGQISTNDLKDIAAYAAYRLNAAKGHTINDQSSTARTTYRRGDRQEIPADPTEAS